MCESYVPVLCVCVSLRKTCVNYSKTGEFEEGIKPDEGTWTREGTSLSLSFFLAPSNMH